MLLVKRLGPSSGDKRYINAIAIAIDNLEITH